MRTLRNEKDKVAHMLRRFGFGASEAEVDYYSRNGHAGAIDLLLGYSDIEQAVEINPFEFRNKQGTVNIRVMQGLYYAQILVSSRPLEEAMTLFWHHHFATSAEKVDSAFAMWSHISLLREFATGNFREMVKAVSRDPAMIYWLDNQLNVAGKPNENFAREVMELFTIGIGHYTEKDVQEAARAFTGWTYGPGGRAARSNTDKAPNRVDQFLIATRLHDDGEKTILGKTGNLSGDDVIDLLCDHPETSRFIVRKLWEWFVYPNPSEETVEKFAKLFRQNNLEIAILIRAILKSEEFYSEKAVHGVIKNPIQFTLSTCRQLGVGTRIANAIKNGVTNPRINEETGVNLTLVQALAPAFTASQSTKAMGMELLYPPDVSGWRTGPYWVTTSTMLERVKWADRLFAGGTAAQSVALGGAAGGRQQGLRVGFQAAPLFDGMSSPTEAVNAILSVFDAEVEPAAKGTLVEAATAVGSRITSGNADAMAIAISRLLFSAPEFQLC